MEDLWKEETKNVDDGIFFPEEEQSNQHVLVHKQELHGDQIYKVLPKAPI